MSMNTPLGTITQTTPINSFYELNELQLNQYLLGINNIAQGDGARITLQNLIKSLPSLTAGNLLQVDNTGKLSVISTSINKFGLNTGWAIAPNLNINWDTNKISSAIGEFYINGVIVPSLSNFELDIPTTNGTHYLSYNINSNTFNWSNTYSIDNFTYYICEIIILTNNTKFAVPLWGIGGIPNNVIDYLNSTIGMIIFEGGQVLNIDYNTASQRYPIINQARIGLANFSQYFQTTTVSSGYTQMHATDENTLTCSLAQAEIVPLSAGTNNPMYLNNYMLTPLEADKFMNVWLVNIPTVNSPSSYLFVTGGAQYDTEEEALSANFNSDSSISVLTSQFARNYVMGMFTIKYTNNNFSITSYKGFTFSSSGSGGNSVNSANIELTNLGEKGEMHFLGDRNVSNGIVSAPTLTKFEKRSDGYYLLSGSIVRFAAGTSAPTLSIGDYYLGYKIIDISFGGGRLVYYVQTDTDYKLTLNTITNTLSQFAVLRKKDSALDKFWSITSNNFKMGETPPTSFANPTLFYNTEANTFTDLSNENEPVSLPICEVFGGTTNNLVSVMQNFQTGGYLNAGGTGGIVWVNKNVIVKAVDGINEKTGFKSIEYTIPYDLFQVVTPDTTFTYGVGSLDITDISNPIFNVGNFSEWNAQDNVFVADSSSWGYTKNLVIVGKHAQMRNGTLSNYFAYAPFRMADAQDTTGKFHYSRKDLFLGITFNPGEQKDYSIADFLPVDNNTYEVYLNVYIRTGNQVGNATGMKVLSDLVPNEGFRICRCQNGVVNRTADASGSIIIPVGSKRQLSFYNVDASGTSGNCGALLIGYRRIV